MHSEIKKFWQDKNERYLVYREGNIWYVEGSIIAIIAVETGNDIIYCKYKDGIRYLMSEKEMLSYIKLQAFI